MKKILLTGLLLSLFTVNAQVYTFNAFNEPYQDLVNSTSLNDGEVWDDPEYQISIGFDFTISTHTFNTIYIVDWTAGGELSTNVNETGVLPIMSPIGQDIVDRGDGTSVSQSNISYKTEGDVGSRILKIEWNNAGFWEDETQNDFINFQMWLYESSNIIEYRYGVSEINNPANSFEGEAGPVVTLIPSIDLDSGDLIEDAYLLEGTPANPNFVVVTPGDEYEGDFLQGAIPSGTVYSFNPGTLSSEEYNTIEFKMYPNPVDSELNILLSTQAYNVTFFNSLGQHLSLVENTKGVFDVSSLNSGIYFVEIKTNTGNIVKRLIKK